MNNTVILTLRGFFKEKQISHTTLAKELGFAKEHIGAILRGERPLSENIASAISKHYGISFDWMMTGKGYILENNEATNIPQINPLEKKKRILQEIYAKNKEIESLRRQLDELENEVLDELEKRKIVDSANTLQT